MGTTAELSRIVHRGEEQRLGARRSVTQPIAVESTLGPGVRLHDLGEGGLGLSCASQQELATAVEMRLGFPNSEERIDVSGTVAWSDASGRAGIRFTKVPPDAAALIKQWLAGEASAASPAEEPAKYDSALAAQVACLGEIADLQSAISTEQLDRDASLNLIVRRMAELTRASGAAIALREDQDVVCRASFGNAPDVGVKLSSTSLSGECLRTGNLVLLEDSENDPRVDPQICRQLNFRSLLILPVLSGSSRVGIAEVLSPAPHNFEGRDVLVVSFLADLIASVSAPPQEETAATMSVGAEEVAAREELDRSPIPLTLGSDAEAAAMPMPVSAPEARSAISQPQEPTFEPLASPVSRPSEEKVQVAQRQFARVQSESAAAERVAPALRPAQTNAAAQPKLRLAPRKMNAAAVAGAILLAVVLAIAFYFLLRKNAPSGKAVEPPAAGSSVPTPAAPASLPATAVSSPANPNPGTAAAKPARAAVHETSTPSSHPSQGSPRELEVVQTTRTSSQSAVEAVPEAPAISQLSSRGSSELAAAIAAVNTPTPGLGLAQSQGVVEGKLIKKVVPRYPELARRAGIAGDVVLTATIGTDGKLKNVKVLSGSPMLREEAVAAAREWRYQPYLLGGKPVETETRITINFHH